MEKRQQVYTALSIAIVGPEKYKFQDLVCVELALALRYTGLTSMVPEPRGGEDTAFTWDDVDGIALLDGLLPV